MINLGLFQKKEILRFAQNDDKETFCNSPNLGLFQKKEILRFAQNDGKETFCNSPNLRQNKGFALIFSMIFLFLIVSFMAVYFLAVANGVSISNRKTNEQLAYYAAETGLSDAYERIVQANNNDLPSSTCTNFNIPNQCKTPFIPSSPNNITDDGTYWVGGKIQGSYAVSIQYFSNPRTNYTITSTGSSGNISKTLQLQIIKATIAKYAYWSQTELNPAFGGPLWWVGEPGLEMLTTGPVQTNGQLNIFGNPVFNGPVTESNLPIVNGSLGSTPTSTTPNYYAGVSSDPNIIFPETIQNDAPSVTIPYQTTLTQFYSVATNGSGMVLTGPSTIIFVHDGTITVTNAKAGYNNKNMHPPANGVIYVQSDPGTQDGNATVQGTVNGQLTVAADQNIYLSGSVSYNQDPRPTTANPAGNPNSTDLLGLVANQNITIEQASVASQAAANGTGPSLEVSAVMVALQGSFQVDNWWVYMGPAGPASNPNAAIMDQFGSLINYVCGATGEMDWSGNLLGGWNQVQAYDPRLASLSPPGFPPVSSATNAVYTKYGAGLVEL